MSADKRWAQAVEHVAATGKVLKDIITASSNPEATHTPSLKNALAHSRSAFVEAQDWEHRVYEEVEAEREAAKSDPHQMGLPLDQQVVRWENDQEFDVWLTVGEADPMLVPKGGYVDVPAGSSPSWTAAETAAEHIDVPEPVEG